MSKHETTDSQLRERSVYMMSDKRFRDMTGEEQRRFIAGLGGLIREKVTKVGAAVVILLGDIDCEETSGRGFRVYKVVSMSNLTAEDETELLKIIVKNRETNRL